VDHSVLAFSVKYKSKYILPTWGLSSRITPLGSALSSLLSLSAHTNVPEAFTSLKQSAITLYIFNKSSLMDN
jgi:hypothetical protein